MSEDIVYFTTSSIESSYMIDSNLQMIVCIYDNFQIFLSVEPLLGILMGQQKYLKERELI